MDWKDCPEVKIRPGYVQGAPTVGDSRVPLETIENGYELGQTPEELADDYDLPIELIRAIFAHIRKHEHAPSL